MENIFSLPCLACTYYNICKYREKFEHFFEDMNERLNSTYVHVSNVGLSTTLSTYDTLTEFDNLESIVVKCKYFSKQGV